MGKNQEVKLFGVNSNTVVNSGLVLGKPTKKGQKDKYE
jgi:hypothetical protein